MFVFSESSVKQVKSKFILQSDEEDDFRRQLLKYCNAGTKIITFWSGAGISWDSFEIDKYAMEDICFQLEENIVKNFGYSHPDLNNEWEIWRN